MAIGDFFEIDDLDKEIISLLQNQPSITHSQIAKKIGRSQPAVGARIHRLEEKGVISAQYGINFKDSKGIFLVKVEISTRNPDKVFEMAKYCPFVVNCLKMSGEFNILCMIASTNLKDVDVIIDNQFRNKPHIEMLQTEIITDFMRDFILPLNFKMENHVPHPEIGCAECSICTKKGE